MTIAIVSTGGTISSVEEEGRDAAPELKSNDLVNTVPELDGLTDIDTRDFSTIVSHHYTIEQMYELAESLGELDADQDIDGIVVTQGTNTLETVSYFVDLCYDGETPVVFTGAMRNPSLSSPDGPGNLLSAVRASMAEKARGMGVLVAFNFEIHTARDVSKLHTQNPGSFRSPNSGPLASIEEDRVVWHRRAIERTPTFELDPDLLTNDVPIVGLGAEVPSTTLEAARDSSAICLVTFGPGHLPPSVIPTLESFREEGISVIASTWCIAGTLSRNTYECYGCENTTRELCYYSDLNPRKTRIKTIVAFAADRLDDAFVEPEEPRTAQ